MDPQRRSLPQISSRSWQIAKLTLQCASLVCCAIMLGLSVSTTWRGGAGVGILTVPVAIAVAVWTIAELVTLFFRRKNAPGRGIHPGAHVGVQLILFLALILALFYSVMLWRSVQRSIEPCNEWTRDPDNSNWATQDTTSYYCPASYRDMINDPSYRSSVQAVIAFCVLLWAIHFTLFVRACVETQRRNSETPAIMMYPQQPWPAQYQQSYPQSYPQGGSGPTPMKHTHYG